MEEAPLLQNVLPSSVRLKLSRVWVHTGGFTLVGSQWDVREMRQRKVCDVKLCWVQDVNTLHPDWGLMTLKHCCK